MELARTRRFLTSCIMIFSCINKGPATAILVTSSPTAVATQQPATTDHVHLLLQVQNYLLQLQSTAVDHKQLLMTVKDKINDLKATDEYLRQNLTQQGQTINLQSKKQQEKLDVVDQKTVNITEILKDLETAISELQNGTIKQRIITKTIEKELSFLSNNLTSFQTVLEGQVQQNNRQEAQMKIMELALQHQLSLITKLEEKGATLTSTVNNLTDAGVFGFTRYGTSLYRLVNVAATWAEAEVNCQLLHPEAHLATVESENENKFILGLIKKEKKVTWFGGSDAVTEGQWRWWNKKLFTYTNWGAGQPDDHKTGEDCVDILTDGKWNDSPCNYKRPFICEIDSA
ncbi:asialoglycoprotein receptor 2-like [Lingula anatina]|uniref:Asialoglycoprotein receptor 2-like n=1 Tax=Lingula anatina TaxID=7574 RepID=A0A1S3IPF7_LINAN|nr:asialoglycoprotein receptor 2-like [Lingula anatina]|eukprot:XP_013399958.1 asialoglycoprotein receptor 2-like [Lingula anatina]